MHPSTTEDFTSNPKRGKDKAHDKNLSQLPTPPDSSPEPEEQHHEQSPPASSTFFPFFALPPELREEILTHAIRSPVNNGEIIWGISGGLYAYPCPHPGRRLPSPLPLFLVSRAFSFLARRLFFRVNTFRCTVEDSNWWRDEWIMSREGGFIPTAEPGGGFDDYMQFRVRGRHRRWGHAGQFLVDGSGGGGGGGGGGYGNGNGNDSGGGFGEQRDGAGGEDGEGEGEEQDTRGPISKFLEEPFCGGVADSAHLSDLRSLRFVLPFHRRRFWRYGRAPSGYVAEDISAAWLRTLGMLWDASESGLNSKAKSNNDPHLQLKNLEVRVLPWPGDGGIEEQLQAAASADIHARSVLPGLPRLPATEAIGAGAGPSTPDIINSITPPIPLLLKTFRHFIQHTIWDIDRTLSTSTSGTTTPLCAQITVLLVGDEMDMYVYNLRRRGEPLWTGGDWVNERVMVEENLLLVGSYPASEDMNEHPGEAEVGDEGREKHDWVESIWFADDPKLPPSCSLSWR
ncbi:hypothetical protein F5Y16DRAFT_400837 [Xylariaceae sp. FL0255]|nr:hypothetical protein F5Y16DRAFT_400837 [Xylariaceae sp. FL0255]